MFDVLKTVLGVRCFVGLLFCSRCLKGLFCSVLDVLFNVLFVVLFDVSFCRPFEVWRVVRCFVRHTHRSVRCCVGSDVLFDVVFANDISHSCYFASAHSMFSPGV